MKVLRCLVRLGRGVALFSTAALMSSALWAQEPEIQLYGDSHQAPFVSTGAEAGLFREASEEMLRRAGLPFRLTLTPWRRAQAALLSGADGLIMNLARTSGRESEYRWMVKVIPTPYVLVSLKQEYQSLPDAFADGAVAALAGTPRAEEALAIGGAEKVVQVNDPQQAVRLLQAGRVVAWYEIDLRALHAWMQAGLDADGLMLGPPQQVTESYLASNPGFPDADRVEGRLRMAFASMQADGTWESILRRYVGGRRARLIAAVGSD